MSKIDLYEVTKRKCEAELKLDALKGQTRLNSLKKISYELDNAMGKSRELNLKIMLESSYCSNTFQQFEANDGNHRRFQAESGDYRLEIGM